MPALAIAVTNSEQLPEVSNYHQTPFAYYLSRIKSKDTVSCCAIPAKDGEIQPSELEIHLLPPFGASDAD